MANKEIKLTTEEGKTFDVPVEGSLGLLAIGYVGLMAWRNKRHEEGYDLVGIKKAEWEAYQKMVDEKRQKIAEKRKEFFKNKKEQQSKESDKKDQKKGGHDPSKDWTGQDKIS